MTQKTLKLCLLPLFVAQIISGANITIWNDTFKELTATINSDTEVKVPPITTKTVDKGIYSISKVIINNQTIKFDGSMFSRFNVTYDGISLKQGKSTLQQYENFINPDQNLRYDEVCFLATHNAHANYNAGYWYAQQRWSITKQLNNGVRCLLLDTWPAYKNNLTQQADPKTVPIDQIEVMLWHDITGRDLKIKFKDALVKIHTFLKNNPDEIVTFILEDHTSADIIDKVFDESTIKELILKPSDWSVSQHDGWPQLKWMIQNNKRLVVFSNKKSSHYAWNTWKYGVHNMYGKTDFTQATVERDQSKRYNDQYLMIINYFPLYSGIETQYTNYGTFGNGINDSKLRQFLLYLVKNGLDCNFRYRFPNFINLNHVHMGNPIRVVNLINHISSITPDRSNTVFRQLIRQ